MFVCLFADKPVTVSIISGRTPLSAGEPARLSCKSTGSRPPAQITWWKASKRMTNTRQHVLPSDKDNTTTTVSILTFVPTKDDNGKYLTCRASNVVISQSAIEDGWKIVVYCKRISSIDYFMKKFNYVRHAPLRLFQISRLNNSILHGC